LQNQSGRIRELELQGVSRSTILNRSSIPEEYGSRKIKVRRMSISAQQVEAIE
jgi:hypothetical protein